MPKVSALRDESGYSLLEMLVSVALLTIVSGTVLEGIFRLTKVSATIANRTAMHSGVRNATELLQQEVGQAGRIALPAAVTLTDAVAAAGTNEISVSSVSGMFVGEKLVVGTGANEETVTLTDVDTTNSEITAVFLMAHPSGAPVNVYGGFASGVVPTTATNGSTGSVLKIFGDVNSDGNMVYVEYTCDTNGGNLYRRSVDFTDTAKPAISADMSLLNNIKPNPDGTDCFTYQVESVNNVPFVVDVAITLTVETPDPDPVTGLHQEETKALLNVSPRNVFNVWQLAGLGISNRVQDMPASVTTLIGLP